jgi:8-oxo-dGTP pyrophosphatase MutT (NUDIX family)
VRGKLTLAELELLVRERLLQPLPGATAHAPMRAIPVGDVIPNFTHKLAPRPGGVVILLYENDGNICFPLIRRAVYTGAHSGQVSLPGGKAEAGETSVQAALRECEEEIGVSPDQLRVIGCLTEFFVIPSNFLITPVVAVANGLPIFNPDNFEVAAMLFGDLAELLDDNAVSETEIVAAGQFRLRAPHFVVGGEVVWGATAMMLNEFRTIVREVAGVH